MVQKLLSWGCGTFGQQKLASTRKLASPAVAIATCAGLLLSVSSAFAGDNQPRGNQPGGTGTGAPTPGAQPVMAPPAAGADVMFRVNSITVQYMGDMSGGPIPSIAQLMNEATVELRPVSNGFTVPDGANGTRYTLAQLNAELARGDKMLSQRALERVLTSIRDVINRRGIVGVWVAYEAGDVEVRQTPSGPMWVDVRQGRTNLTIGVSAARVGQGNVRTVGEGERAGDAPLVNASMHDRIRRNSPVKSGGLLNKDQLDSYVFRLNRRPGRQVDIAVSGSEQPGMANIDYIVRENRPWSIYAQVSNTGTEATGGWRERFGFFHNQLTNEDDTLSIDYSTGNFTDSHAVQGSYERPIGNWDRLRFQIFGGWNRWDASEVGVTNEEFSGQGMNVGGKVTWNVFQWRESFFDIYSGVKYAHYKVNNSTILVSGSGAFLLPFGGVTFERNTDKMTTNVDVGIEGNMGDMIGTPDGFELDALGRGNADRDFIILSFNVEQSMYLEPLFDGRNFEAGKSTLAHELFLSLRGQTSFGNRLVPNFQGVAGGLYTVRGYEESEQAGDDLVLFTAEYRMHVPRMFAIQDKPGTDMFGRPFRWSPQQAYARPDWDLILRGFVDVGYTGLADKLTFESNETMVGVGVGAEVQFWRNINARVDLGVPVTDTDRSESGDPRIHFAVTLLY